MPIAIYLGAVGGALALIIWTVSTLRTDPRGFAHVATCFHRSEAVRAAAALEQRGIAVRLDDHAYVTWSGRAEGPVRVLVPEEQMNEAVETLRAHIAAEQRARYMRLVS